ncbi:endonuclease/exonuclease/phosphatase family protein [Polaribacter sp. 11A2H]|uniref:endonuclease/exonuclease/phosphatase family protein n=1 Tax=Polaribacter sp. 11A2H TaxID=2687290 RepID=UPI00140A2DE1|nr:endonuclease/exonuclease/phosphatase family protein [Polaribacter sp. 11A2H]
MSKKIFFIFIFSLTITVCNSQKNEKKYNIRTIAFYNLENLFDTINDVNKNDEASPIMELKSNRSKVYWDKIEKLSSTIAQIGADKSKTSPAIIGVSEVENLNVLEDLIHSKHLIKNDYGIIHYDSPDKRGIDVALLYQKKYFNPIYHEAFNPKIFKDNYPVYTRDQLLVSGYLDDELIHIIVNHWPSRRGGEAASRPNREKAAYQNTKIIAQVREQDANAKILIMGDFNDDPNNSSFKNVLKTKSRKKEVAEGDLYNPYEDMFRRGFNTLKYRDKINLFDMIFFTSPLLDKGEKDFSTYKMYKAMIFNKRFLTTKKGKYKGYPFRSFSSGNYTGGYSDHYPVYLYLIKEAKQNK